MPELSVVIPTLARSQALDHVLRGLAAQELPPGEMEVIVALDAAATGGDPLRGRAHKSLAPRVIRASRAGASAARNAGWRAASSQLILFLDDDILPRPGLIREHVSWQERHPEPEVAVLGLVRWSRQMKVTPFMRWLDRGIQFDYGAIATTDAGWGRFYSCNISVKREILERVGGFDECRFPYGYEDLELARRLSDHGLRVLYNPAAVGEHLKTETLEGWSRNLHRIAVAEYRFTQLYPEQTPYFYEKFRAAVGAAPSRGRWARLVRWVPPSLPWLGPIVWRSYDLACRQRLGPEFLSEWNAAAAAESPH